MKKKLISLVLAFSIISSNATVIFAEESTSKSSQATQKVNYTNVRGEVVAVAYQETFKRLVVKYDDGNVVAFNFKPNAPIYNYDRLQSSPFVGDRVVISYPTNAPMTSSFPPQINASAAVIVPDDESFHVLIDYFDENGFNANKSKQVIKIDSTVIYDSRGNKISFYKAGNKILIVLFNYTKDSSSKEIIAKRIIALDNTNLTPYVEKQMQNYFSSLNEEQFINYDAESFIRLSDLADKFGYTVGWDNETREILMSKGNEKYKIQVDSTEYSMNDNIGYFYEAPILRNGKTYVEKDFALKIFLDNFKE